MKHLATIAGITACVLLSAHPAGAGKDRSLEKAESYVDARCPASTREISHADWESSFRFNALFGNCRAGDGRDQHVWFFVDGRFVGADFPNSSHWITPIWRDDKTLAFMYALYRQTDPECCPTGGGKIVRFRWTGEKVKRLDPAPPRAFTPGVTVGR